MSIDDLITAGGDALDKLNALKADGVVLDPQSSGDDDFVKLITIDPVIARKHGMQEESEFWESDVDSSLDDEDDA